MGRAADERQGGAEAGSAAARREERLAQALRLNLKRRKDQARGRIATGAGNGPEVQPDF